MFAMVDAAISTRLNAPRCNRSGASGAFVSEYGTEAMSLLTSVASGEHYDARSENCRWAEV